MKNMLTSIVLAAAFSATAQAWTTMQGAADRMGAAQVKEISFEKNSEIMTDVQKSEIRSVIQEASRKGKIDEVKVLAWSDKEYPSEKGKQDKADVNLAKNRLKNLKNFLKDELKVSSVEAHNMTERPNALQKLFNTSDAKVKNAAETTGAAPTEGNTGLFDMKALASKAAVMVFMRK